MIIYNTLVLIHPDEEYSVAPNVGCVVIIFFYFNCEL